jgi:hypothetical protein
MIQWPSWKVPEAFIWNAINSTGLSKRKENLNYGRRSVGQLFLVSSSHLEPMTNFCFLFDNCLFLAMGHRLWRGWVSNLLVQLLLGLARANTAVQVPQNSDHILLSRLRLPQPGEPGPRIYIPQEQGVPVTPPGTGFHFRHLLRLARMLRWR